MENKELNALLNLYEEQLTTISGIKFTHREMDIITFIFHTRGSSKIASLLSISNRTVETHTANIMRKMDTNSREGIIDFVNKHGHTLRIKKHYQALLVQLNFSKRLQEVARHTKNKNLTSTIIFNCTNSEEKTFINVLKGHLTLCGITTVLIEAKNEWPIAQTGPLSCLEPDDHILYFIHQGLIDTYQSDPMGHKQSVENLSVSSQAFTFLLWGKNYTEEGLSPIFTDNAVCFGEDEKYFYTFFSLLKRMLPDKHIEEIVSTFQKDQESTNEVLQQDIFDHSAYLEKSPSETPSSKRRIASSLLIATTLIITIYLGFSFFNINNAGFLSGTESNTSSSIRSDLLVPTGNIFLKRPNVMSKIAEGLKDNKGIQTVAIVGIGGAGKTTIARQYALQQNANIVWEINAATRESLKDSFERLAYALCKSEEDQKSLMGLQNIKNKIEKDEKILLLVKEKLKQDSKWFLIYDNVNKFTNIQQYFPCDSTVWGNGKIIITTTDSNTKNNSLINHFIYIGELTPKEKLGLFMKIMGNENDQKFSAAQEDSANKFLNDVPPFPLDVSIAAYYLKSTNTPYTKYLEQLKNDSKDFETIQADVVKEASGYTKTRYSIVSVSLKELIGTHQDFVDLLSLISLLDYQNIPRTLLSSYKSDIVVDNFIYNLKKYSLITSESSVGSISTISFHRATQEIILAYLNKTMALSPNSPRIQDVSNTLEKYMVETIDNEDFSKMKLLAPHCEAFLNHDHYLNTQLKSSVGGTLGCIYYYLRYNLKAKQLLESNLAVINHQDPANQDRVALILAYLGSFYRAQGDYDKAKTLLESSLIIYKKTPNHVKKARALGYLGLVYRDIGDYKRAKLLLEQSLEIHENQSENHIGQAWILTHLGNIDTILGDYQKAKLLLEQSLLIYKKQSEDYVGVAWTLGYLSNVYRALGDFQKAKALVEQSLNITRKHFGDNHIYVARRLSSLGAVYAGLSNYQKAKGLLKESLLIYEKEYGKNHIETARVLKSLGETYSLEGDMETAEELLNKALLVFQQIKSPEVYKSLESLGDLYGKKAKLATAEGSLKYAQNYHEQAHHYWNQALEMTKEYFQDDSPHTLRIKKKLNFMPTLRLT